VNVDQEGAAGDDVVTATAATHEALRGALGADRANGTNGSDRGRSRQDPSRRSDCGGAHLVAQDGKRGSLISLRKHPDFENLALCPGLAHPRDSSDGLGRARTPAEQIPVVAALET
jgi:hypothetical protein